jgi:hypothetical protein
MAVITPIKLNVVATSSATNDEFITVNERCQGVLVHRSVFCLGTYTYSQGLHILDCHYSYEGVHHHSADESTAGTKHYKQYSFALQY